MHLFRKIIIFEHFNIYVFREVINYWYTVNHWRITSLISITQAHIPCIKRSFESVSEATTIQYPGTKADNMKPSTPFTLITITRLRQKHSKALFHSDFDRIRSACSSQRYRGPTIATTALDNKTTRDRSRYRRMRNRQDTMTSVRIRI